MSKSRVDRFIEEFNDDYVKAFGVSDGDLPENLLEQYLLGITGGCVTLGFTFGLSSGKRLYLQIADDEFVMIEVDNMSEGELAIRVARDLTIPYLEALDRVRRAFTE